MKAGYIIVTEEANDILFAVKERKNFIIRTVLAVALVILIFSLFLNTYILKPIKFVICKWYKKQLLSGYIWNIFEACCTKALHSALGFKWDIVLFEKMLQLETLSMTLLQNVSLVYFLWILIENIMNENCKRCDTFITNTKIINDTVTNVCTLLYLVKSIYPL